MDLSLKFKYITIYLVLNSLGIYIAILNWWPKDFFLIFGVGLCWFGILFLSIMISMLMIPNQKKNDFISIFSLATKEDYEEVFGKTEAKKMSLTIKALSFGILISTICVFSFVMNLYEENQLEKHGIIENVRVSKIIFDQKKNEKSLILYNNKKHSTTLLTKLFSEKKSAIRNDTIKIIYSSENPKIVELYTKYLNDK